MLSERLWRALLVAAVLFVIADFVRTDWIGPPLGRASVAASDVTLLMPLGDASSPLHRDADALAVAMTGAEYSASARSSGRSTAATLIDFSRSRERDGSHLLLLTSSSLAEVARAVRQPASRSEAAQARLALRDLRRLVPVAGAWADTTAIAVPRETPRLSRWTLAAGLGSADGLRVTGIGTDAASKATLAGLVRSLGIDGRVPYRAFPSGADSTLSLATGGVDLVLAPRSQLLGKGLRSGTRLVGPAEVPGVGLRAPLWGMVVAPASVDPRARRLLSRRVAHSLASRSWRAYARPRGLRRLGVRAANLDAFLSREQARSAALAVLTASVPEQR